MGEYGLIFFPLTTSGGATATPKDALDRQADAGRRLEGPIYYERTFPAEMIPDGLLEHLSTLHVVQHGIDANNNGKYDMDALGESTFAKNQGKPGVPEEVTNPAACGVVEGAGAADPPRDGIETGGAPAPDLSAPLGAAGAALLLLSGALLFWRRPARATTTVADDGRMPPALARRTPGPIAVPSRFVHCRGRVRSRRPAADSSVCRRGPSTKNLVQCAPRCTAQMCSVMLPLPGVVWRVWGSEGGDENAG